MTSPTLLDGQIRFSYPDHDPSVTGVVLQTDRAIPGDRELVRDPSSPIGWRLDLPRPALQRIEYRYAVAHGDHVEVLLDPANPITVRTAFGERSVLELPDYHPPQWLQAPAVEGRFEPHLLAGETDGEVPVSIWTPAGLADHDPAPLLVVHDGPEYDVLASITRYSGAAIAAGLLPPHRLALAHPVMRDAWYSGSPKYLRTIATAGLDRVEERYAVSGPIAVMGASLGGLTALLVGLLAAPRIGAVFAQSGSFFQTRLDASESGYPYFGRISRLVEAVLHARHTDHPLRIGMTCGSLEENAANNRAMAAALRRAGHTVTHREVPDLHNYTAWRDSLHPDLTTVLRDTWV